jgi:hypothetical protein
MENRRYPRLTATRFTVEERAWIDALAGAEGVTVTTLLRQIVLPEVRERILLALDGRKESDG